MVFFSAREWCIPNLSFLRLDGQAALCLPAPSTVTTLCLKENLDLWFDHHLLREMLRTCPALTSLSFSACAGRIDDFDVPLSILNAPGLKLSNLHHLHLAHGFQSILLLISAPQLMSLQIDHFQPMMMQTFLKSPQIVHASSPKFPALTSLTLLRSGFDDWKYYDLFQAFPDIRHFSVIDPPWESVNVLEQLQGRRGRDTALDVPWPGLQTITLNQVPFDKLIRERFFRLISARIALGAPLLEAYLDECDILRIDSEPEQGDWVRAQIHLRKGRREDDGHQSLVEFADVDFSL